MAELPLTRVQGRPSRSDVSTTSGKGSPVHGWQPLKENNGQTGPSPSEQAYSEAKGYQIKYGTLAIKTDEEDDRLSPEQYGTRSPASLRPSPIHSPSHMVYSPNSQGNLSPSRTLSPPFASPKRAGASPSSNSQEMPGRRSNLGSGYTSPATDSWANRAERENGKRDRGYCPPSPSSSNPREKRGGLFRSRSAVPAEERTLVEEFVEPDDESRPYNSIPSLPRHQRHLQTAQWALDVRRMICDGDWLGAIRHTAPKQGMVQCYVKRSKNFIGTQVMFEMHLEESRAFVLAARRRKTSRSSQFLISHDREELKRGSQKCHSKVKANWVGTDYILYSRGEGIGSGTPHVKEEVGIHFVPTATSLKGGPRMFYVTCPLPNGGWNPTAQDGSDSLAACLEMARNKLLPEQVEKCLALLSNKPPDYDAELKAFSLHFSGRVKEASVKNFQLVRWDHKTDTRAPELILQFGKVDEHLFALDFAYPLNIHTAFAIALASLDTKLCYAV